MSREPAFGLVKGWGLRRIEGPLWRWGMWTGSDLRIRKRVRTNRILKEDRLLGLQMKYIWWWLYSTTFTSCESMLRFSDNTHFFFLLFFFATCHSSGGPGFRFPLVYPVCSPTRACPLPMNVAAVWTLPRLFQLVLPSSCLKHFISL